MSTSPSSPSAPAGGAAGPSLYRLIWRWHFYAGLFCVPFVLWLAVTGSIYVFHPQLDALFDRPYNHVDASAPRRPVSEQVQAALATVPGAVLNAYQLPAGPTASAQVLVGRRNTLQRVYVDPVTAKVLYTVPEDHRFTRRVFHLHGELLMGAFGSALVELAACWTIVMLLSGLYLWWPRGRRLAGVLYPRLAQRGRVFWRDLHAVTGVWISVLALFLLFTGLPWAKFWGGELKQVRHWVAANAPQQDWTTGRASELALRRARNTPVSDEHAGMPGMGASGESASPHAPIDHAPIDDRPIDYTPMNRIVPVVRAMRLPPPVLISPPSSAMPHWSARSDTPDRPERVELAFDPASGQVLSRRGFDQRPLLDRIIGYGIAAHEGQLFGLANQLLSVFTALGLIVLSTSGLVLWWRRRPQGQLGAPSAASGRRVPLAIKILIVLLCVYLPLLGVSLLLVWLLERLVLSRIASTRQFLGLT